MITLFHAILTFLLACAAVAGAVWLAALLVTLVGLCGMAFFKTLRITGKGLARLGLPVPSPLALILAFYAAIFVPMIFVYVF